MLHNQPNASALVDLQRGLTDQNRNTGTLSKQLWDYCAYAIFDNIVGRRPNISAWDNNDLGLKDSYPSFKDEAPKECSMIESVSNCKCLKAPDPEAREGFDNLALALTVCAF